MSATACGNKLDLTAVIVYIKAEKFDDAIEIAKKAIELSGDDYSLYYVLGTACMASKKFEESVIYIGKAIELNPQNLQLYNNLGTSYLSVEGKYAPAHIILFFLIITAPS